ncbi:LuxR C-terminal-related transcriptional regulator [Streptomyces sp. NBC_00006]|uniref:ATP-binding protein n=1 Tax=Streptomyces sp. NBC_00006 TaxID=2975619 RepID=UPI00225C1FBB|nr:LuxR C-terminal-related transcriptional regulator [Streptomyces sp. NBC_00006]MCX5533685.1 LuxR C-terminal-related transcriptional regulator [Streptomyces sp. NBC_00006]
MATAMDTAMGAVGELPAETTSFVGRAPELARIKEAFTRSRLVTLTGPGGVGKSRTAVRSAREHLGDFPDGVRLVPLSGLSDPELLPHTVCGALGLAEQGGRGAAQTLAAHLAGRRTLVVLDTCEHLVDACASLADTLLRAAPGLRLLATSRQPLDIPGEQVLPVPPLALPEPDPGADGRSGAELPEAVRLFVDRAAGAAPEFALTDGNRAAVHALCRRLDGIPLAIELAVARLRVISPEQMLRRLDHRFRLLTGGRSVTVPRHQTLRTTIDWSHELCTEQERLLWARLSVFAGGFDLEAAEVVCSDVELPLEEVLDALVGLVDKSVVRHLETEDGPRYRMLDTLREFGLENLVPREEEERVRGRHRDHFLECAGQFDAEWSGDGQLPWVRRLVADHENLQAAMEYSFTTPGEEYAGLQLAVRLWGYWACTSLLTQARHWLRRGLAGSKKPTPERAKALWSLSGFMDIQGDVQDNRVLLDEAEEIARALGDRSGLAWTLTFRTFNKVFLGAYEGCAEGYAEARRMHAEAGDEFGRVTAGYYLAGMYFLAGQVDEPSMRLCDEGLEYVAAMPKECWTRGWVLWIKSLGLWFGGEHAASAECAREGLRAKLALHDMVGIAHCLENLAWRAAEEGKASRVAVLHGAAERLWGLSALVPRYAMPTLNGLHDEAARVSREALGEHEFQRCFREGEALTTREAVERALTEDLPPAPVVPAQRSPGGAEALTPREREVASLVADGLTNREIAERLVISKRTADAHVEHILTKLGVGTRTQIAALCASDDEEVGDAAGAGDASGAGDAAGG